MRIPRLQFRIGTILIAIAAVAAGLALYLQFGPLSKEARRIRLQRQFEQNQQVIERYQQMLDRNRLEIERTQQEFEKTRAEFEKTRAEYERTRAEYDRMQRRLEEMKRTGTGKRQTKDDSPG